MKRITVGILAHVDSGKTTLSEGLLFAAGEIRKQGRVDHGDAFLDTDALEKERGITIFSKQAVLHLPETELTLLDTPGHVDFSAEMERTLPVLDYAILVVSGSDGVQSHTETLFHLLSHYNVPVFLFLNKMDLGVNSRETLLQELQECFGDGCLDFSALAESAGEEERAAFLEAAAMQGQELLEEYLARGTIGEETLRRAIAAREIFPCFFGSALKYRGVEEFLMMLERYTQPLPARDGDPFSARVFKISEDERGKRLTHLKVLSGSLKVKELLSYGGGQQKVNELRVYSGARYRSEQEVFAGSICVVPGLSGTFPGQGLGSAADAGELLSEPLFTYTVKLPDGTDSFAALAFFRKLEEEETKMRVLWNERFQTISVQVMGDVQLEVLKRILEDRFGLSAEFEQGRIIYQETIAAPALGVGHYEPLRHYAEVHLLLEPAERGSGLTIGSAVSGDVLDRNWQRLILSHLTEKTFPGVLTGSPITDMKITLVAGAAHLKHTEGGDFRQATYRAVRQGLMQAENILLEPYYDFRLEVPLESVGRAMTDLNTMGAKALPPETRGEFSVLTGSAPVAALRDYQKSVVSYTRGRGKLSCTFAGYAPCADPEKVIQEFAYDPGADLENPPDSVFCEHGAGHIVKWNEVYERAHLPLLTNRKENEEAELRQAAEARERQARSGGSSASGRTGGSGASDAELLAIFEKTYGKVKSTTLHRPAMRREMPQVHYRGKELPAGLGESYLLIDGYNIIFAWEELKKIAAESLDLARTRLIDRICNYQAFTKENVILVFDAYRVQGGVRKTEKVHGITVIYTKEAETADQYIEKTTKALPRGSRVRVATSDHLEQIIILGHGANRIPASEFLAEVRAAEEEIRRYLK